MKERLGLATAFLVRSAAEWQAITSTVEEFRQDLQEHGGEPEQITEVCCDPEERRLELRQRRPRLA